MIAELKAFFHPKKFIELKDEKGNIFKISEKRWLRKELPKQLRLHWNDTKRLSDDIAYALKDGYAKHVLNACERLIEIDLLPERSYVLHAICLYETNFYEKANSVMVAYHKKFTKTSASLINHAKIISKIESLEKAESMLWDGLKLDPNTDEGIAWYTSISKDRFGEEGYKNALEKVASIKGSWKAFLWLGRFYLTNNDTETAFKVYNNYFRIAEEKDRALLMLSADLGQHGLLKDMIELVGIQYIPDQHDPRIGFNLLKAYKSLDLIKDFEMLENQLRALDKDDINKELEEFEER